MTTTPSFFEASEGHDFLVTGLSSGRELFLGRALERARDEHLVLEGKVVSRHPDGTIVARPFVSKMSFFLLDSGYTVQQITDAQAQREAEQFHSFGKSLVSPTVFPQLHRWFESAFPPDETETVFELEGTGGSPGMAAFHPVHGMLDEFVTTAEQFRRALFHARQVQTCRELDKVAELQGDLVVQVGKITNQAAVRFNELLARESELFEHLEACYGDTASSEGRVLEGSGFEGGGFVYLMERLYLAKSYARRSGRAAVVREVNALVREAFSSFTDTVFEHGNALDTLMTETFSQYGIAVEIHGDFSGHRGLSSPVPNLENTESAVAQPVPSGVS